MQINGQRANRHAINNGIIDFVGRADWLSLNAQTDDVNGDRRSSKPMHSLVFISNIDEHIEILF